MVRKMQQKKLLTPLRLTSSLSLAIEEGDEKKTRGLKGLNTFKEIFSCHKINVFRHHLLYLDLRGHSFIQVKSIHLSFRIQNL